MTRCKFRNWNTSLIGLMFLALLPVTKVTAQNPAMDRLNAYKIAFFTKRLNLTSQEAEKFWPVYNEFQDRRNSIQQERALLNRRVNQGILKMSEKELTEAGDMLISLEVREAELSLEYHNKFKQILSPAKVLRLYQAENQYRLQLLKELQDNNPQRNNIQREPGLYPQ